MSAASWRDRPRRSVLALPGSNPRFLEKAASLHADGLVLDLEDAVARSAKIAARDGIADALARHDYGERVVSVRVNGWRSGLTVRDVQAVVTAEAAPHAVALPKTDSPGDVAALERVLEDAERDAGRPPGMIGIDVLIETAAGLRDVAAILGASHRIWSVAIGRADLAASLGMPMLLGGGYDTRYPGDQFHGVLLTVLVAARAAGLPAIDGPYLSLEDSGGLARLAGEAAALGYDGKWAIHPDQLATINAAFTPTPEQLARAEAMLGSLEEAERAEGRGALRDEGELLDEASRKLALSLLARGARAKRTVA